MDEPAKTPQTSGGSGLAPNIASLLCYVCSFVTGIIFLLIEKENKDVRFHAWQAILLGGGWIVLWIVLMIVTAILGAISSALGAVFSLLVTLLGLAVFVVAIIAMVKAFQGERWKIPYLGDIAEQQANK